MGAMTAAGVSPLSGTSSRPFTQRRAQPVLQRTQRLALPVRGPAKTGGRRGTVLVQAAFGSKATAKATYVCIDCGWIYDGIEAFNTLPGSYRCPVCNAPKRRFKQEAPASGKGSARSSSRNGGSAAKASAPDRSDGPPLAVVAVGGIAFLAAVYVGLNALY